MLFLVFHVKHFRFIHSFTRLHSFGHSASLVRRLFTSALFRSGFIRHSVRGLFARLPFCQKAKCCKQRSPLADLLYCLTADKARLQASPLTPFLITPTLHRAYVHRLLTSFSSIPSFVSPRSFVHYATVFHVKHQKVWLPTVS